MALPEDEGQIAWVLREAESVLAIGAQSSLTGGATPFGEWLLSTARLDRLGSIEPGHVEVGAGLALSTLEAELHARGLCYPPVPTFRGAFVGGTLATNAAGAATFKYGCTRDWVRALDVVLASGEVLELRRGECLAHADGYFELESTDGRVARVPLPGYRLPDVPKRSAGYHAAPGMDLVDLFVGSEGTLGVIVSAELGLIPEPARLWAFVTLASEAQALRLVAALRDAARATWSARDPAGLDVAAVESLDRRCLELLREDGQDGEQRVHLPATAEAALLVELELRRPEAADLALETLVRLLEAERAEGEVEIALPGDLRRARQFQALREAVPEGVNRRIAELQRTREPRLHKLAGDMIVPFAALPEMVARYRAAFAERGLDHALWGHVSDGNLHANVLPRSYADLELGTQALLELGGQAIALGGCPMSEHGVGRSALKQELLLRLYGSKGVAAMRAVKAALDPEGKLAPGVLFARGGGMPDVSAV
jgi:D-lactate dehydrogenase (cytochrome)